MGKQMKRDYRISLSQGAHLLVGELELDATVLDLSKSGARIVCAERFEVGEVVQIRLDRHAPIPAKVKWTSQGEFGAHFLTPVEDF